MPPRRSRFLTLAFLLLALPLQLFLAVNVPTGEIPDEVAHMVRMESLLHGVLVGHRSTRLDRAGNTVPDGGVTANPGMLAAGFTFEPGTVLAERVLSRERAAEMQAKAWAPAAEFVSVPNTAVYSPLFYVPGAAGMAVARAFGWGPWQAVLAARVANVLAYVALGAAALLLARRAQGLLLATLLLPMSLWLGASCNQDGLLIATSVLAAGLLTRGTMAGWWGGAAALGAVCLAKALYLPLAGIVVLALPLRGALPGLRGAGAVLAAGPGVIWFLIAQRFAVVPFVRGEPFKAGPLWPGDPDQVFTVVDSALQLQVLLHRPSLLLRLPLETLWANGGWYAWEFVGILGVLDILLPLWFYPVWMVAIGCLLAGESLAGRREMLALRPLACLAALACLGAAMAALFDGQYLSWTTTGAREVQGMQGRYFLPLLPFLALALPAVRLPGADPLRRVLRVPVLGMGLAGLALIPALVVSTYYLR